MRRNMGSVISFFRVVRSGLSPVARSTGTRTAEATARPTSLASPKLAPCFPAVYRLYTYIDGINASQHGVCHIFFQSCALGFEPRDTLDHQLGTLDQKSTNLSCTKMKLHLRFFCGAMHSTRFAHTRDFSRCSQRALDTAHYGPASPPPLPRTDQRTDQRTD